MFGGFLNKVDSFKKYLTTEKNRVYPTLFTLFGFTSPLFLFSLTPNLLLSSRFLLSYSSSSAHSPPLFFSILFVFSSPPPSFRFFLVLLLPSSPLISSFLLLSSPPSSPLLLLSSTPLLSSFSLLLLFHSPLFPPPKLDPVQVDSLKSWVPVPSLPKMSLWIPFKEVNTESTLFACFVLWIPALDSAVDICKQPSPEPVALGECT